MGKKKNLKFNFCKFFLLPPSPLFWAYLDITLFWGTDWKNYNIPMKLISLSILKKNSKNQDNNSAHRYLPEISFVPQRDNGPLGVKKFTLLSDHVFFFLNSITMTMTCIVWSLCVWCLKWNVLDEVQSTTIDDKRSILCDQCL